jgi:hypothetical protein
MIVKERGWWVRMINKFIACIGFTTDIGETVPEEYFF